ncbi:MAG: hypothetical protein OXG38_01405 [Chloroflexi bacterium]|nr:hypothetical protein [Chloroflexota bacterium]
MDAASRPPARLSRRALLRRGGVLAIGATGLALVGCGDDSDLPAPPAVEEAPEEQTAATAAAAPAPAEQAERSDAPAEAEAADQSQASAEQAEPDDGPETATEQSDEPAEEAAVVQAEEPPAPIIPDPARRMLMPDRVCADCTLEDPAFEPLPNTRAFFGYADGAAYRIEVPNEWNGTLLLFARGVGGLNDAGTGFTTHIDFGGFAPGRELLTSFGVAWAASTYAATGYAPARGVDDLLTVKEIAEAEVGPAQWTYCVGASMGGGTAQLMAQEFPEEIDGALALCGALSNVEVVDYLAGWHSVAHWLIGEDPSATDAAGLIDWATALGSVDDGGLHLTPRGEQFAAVIEELSGGPRWGFREGLARQWQTNFALGTLYVPELVAQAPLPAGAVLPHDGSLLAFDTRDVVYGAHPEAGVDVDRLNEEVIRFQPPPGLRDDPALGVASGVLGAPLLTVKTSGDLWTPISLDRSYARKVQAAGSGDFLVQRAVRRAGHCNFTEQDEVLRALLDLTRWVTEGVRPEGEDLTGDDLSGAGVRFTSPFDADDPLAPAAWSLPRRRLIA